MDEKVLAADPAHAAGFKYFYEIVVGTIMVVFFSFQGWISLTLIKHGKKIATIEAERITRADFERWREEQQVQLDELRSSTIASGAAAVAVIKESQQRVEAHLTRGLERVEGTQRELLIAMAKHAFHEHR